MLLLYLRASLCVLWNGNRLPQTFDPAFNMIPDALNPPGSFDPFDSSDSSAGLTAIVSLDDEIQINTVPAEKVLDSIIPAVSDGFHFAAYGSASYLSEVVIEEWPCEAGFRAYCCSGPAWRENLIPCQKCKCSILFPNMFDGKELPF